MKKFRAFFEKYERTISAVSIVVGFAIDAVTFTRIDFFVTKLLLVIYLAVVASGIIFINLYEAGRTRALSQEGYRWLFVAMQFSYGGLFGRFLIYYSRSGSFFSSWPFLLILLVLLIGNEFAKKYYTRLVLQCSFFFLALFLFFILYVPILVGSMGGWIFLASGVVTAVLTSLFLRTLEWLVPQRMKASKLAIEVSIISIFLSMNLLYFWNIIPPIPLALHDVGVYHLISRNDQGYDVSKEAESDRSFFTGTETVHLVPGNPLYIYSAVFAPTNFGTAVVHRWQKYDDARGAWVNEGDVTFPIIGGQDRGYRGYSEKTNLSEGLWRVQIETVREQVIGEIKFRIQNVFAEPALVHEQL